MQIFIYGGSGSGKSALAERLLERFSETRGRFYIATMQPAGEEARQRIQRHRAARSGKGFVTVEKYTRLYELAPELPPDSSVLLECLGNLTANELFSPKGAGAGAKESVLRGISAIGQRVENLVVVSNDVGADGTAYPPETAAYQQLLACLNRLLCAKSDAVIEMVCGIPVFRKGVC